MDDIYNLTGKTAIVTGSSSGIGKAIALLFGQRGAEVVVTYHSGRDRAAAVVDEIVRGGGKARAFELDASDEQDVERFFREVEQNYRDADILVNNAGINGSGIPVIDMSTEVWDRVIKTNLYGPFYCSRAFLRLKRKNGTFKGSRIINVTSIHEFVNVPGNANYNASKAGMRNFAYTLALEVADKGMTVNNIAPGMILTPINEKVIEDPKKLAEAEAIIPFHRGGDPKEVANVALFLASDASSYVSGATYTVDGALSILGPNA